MADVAELSVLLRLRDQATAGLKNFRGRLTEISSQARTAGMGLMALSAPILALGGASAKAFGTFEQSMARVQAVSGATEDAFRDLNAIAREMGETTMFTASQSAEALGFMSMAGMRATDSVGALPSVLQLSAAGAVELGTAADIVTNIMAGFGLSVEDLGRANDVLTTGFTSTNTSLVQLGEAFKMAGPIGKAAGLSFEETAAALSLMGNAGIQASLAGTSLRGAISRLLNPTKESAALMTEVGLSAVDASGKLLPMTEIIGQLEDVNLSAANAMEIFGLRAGPAMLALVGQGSGALEELVEKMENSGGVAERIATVQLETLQGSFLVLKSAAESAMITIGEQLAPTMESLAKIITENIAKVRDFTEKHPQLTKVVVAATVVLAALAAGLIALGFILPALISVWGLLTAAVGLFGVTLSAAIWPATLVVAALTALGAAAVMVVRHWDDLKKAGKQAWEGIKIIVGDAVMWIQDSLAKMVNSVIGSWNYLAEQLSKIPLVDVAQIDEMEMHWADSFGEMAYSAEKEMTRLRWECKGAAQSVQVDMEETAGVTGQSSEIMNTAIDKTTQTLETLGLTAGSTAQEVGDASVRMADWTAASYQRMLDSTTALNQAGPAFAETMAKFEEMGFSVAASFDLAVLKIGTEFKTSLEEALGAMEDGGTVLAAMTEGVITQEAALAAVTEQYGSLEKALEATAEATKVQIEGTQELQRLYDQFGTGAVVRAVGGAGGRGGGAGPPGVPGVDIATWRSLITSGLAGIDMEAGNAVTLVALMVRNLETAFGAIPQQLRHLIPEFAGGGIVPGSVGQASLAVVHGGNRSFRWGLEQEAGDQLLLLRKSELRTTLSMGTWRWRRWS